MIYYIAKFSDDHIILGDEIHIDQLIRDYDKAHRATLTHPKARIVKPLYLRLKGFSPLQWLLYMQGNPLIPLSDGKKELLAKLIKKEHKRNIPL